MFEFSPSRPDVLQRQSRAILFPALTALALVYANLAPNLATSRLEALTSAVSSCSSRILAASLFGLIALVHRQGTTDRRIVYALSVAILLLNWVVYPAA